MAPISFPSQKPKIRSRLPALEHSEQHKHSSDMGPRQALFRITGTSINHLVRREELAKITGGFPALLTQERLNGFGINGYLLNPDRRWVGRRWHWAHSSPAPAAFVPRGA